MPGWTDKWMDGWMDGWTDGWMDGLVLLLLPLPQKPLNLLINETAVSLKWAEVYFPSLNKNNQTEKGPRLNTSQYSKTVAVRGLHRQATVERESHMQSQCFYWLNGLKTQTLQLPPTTRCHVWIVQKKFKTRQNQNMSEEWDRVRKNTITTWKRMSKEREL